MGNSGFRFPFAHWPTDKTPPGSLFFTFWRAVNWLLLNGFEVIYCCLDGSETNRSFIKLHFKDKDPVVEKFTITNPYTRSPFVFFMDPEVILDIKGLPYKHFLLKFALKSVKFAVQSVKMPEKPLRNQILVFGSFSKFELMTDLIKLYLLSLIKL